MDGEGVKIIRTPPSLNIWGRNIIKMGHAWFIYRGLSYYYTFEMSRSDIVVSQELTAQEPTAQ